MSKPSIAGMGDVKTRYNISSIIKEEVPPQKQLIGIYFEPEVAAILHQFKQKGKRGDQSKIVNEAVKALFREKGFMA